MSSGCGSHPICRDDKWYSCDDEVVSEIPSRTPPRTDKPYRPVVDDSAKPGKIDSFFDKTPKPKVEAKQVTRSGKKDAPWVVRYVRDGPRSPERAALIVNIPSF